MNFLKYKSIKLFYGERNIGGLFVSLSHKIWFTL